jgi:hypothetical protein
MQSRHWQFETGANHGGTKTRKTRLICDAKNLQRPKRDIPWDVFFYINRFGTGPVHNFNSLFDFGFEFADIFVFENDSPLSTMRKSPTLLVLGVRDSPSQRSSGSILSKKSQDHWTLLHSKHDVSVLVRQKVKWIYKSRFYRAMKLKMALKKNGGDNMRNL